MNDNHHLTQPEKQTLLAIARQAITHHLQTNQTIDLDTHPLTPTLRTPHGAFVTLRKDGLMRGCSGDLLQAAPLAQTIRDNAIHAATRDPRFPPLTPDEIQTIQIEISLLCPTTPETNPFTPVTNPNQIQIGRDGLYLDHAGPRGGALLLPQVATDHGWDPQAFINAICQHAQAPPNAWETPGNTLYRFTLQSFTD